MKVTLTFIFATFLFLQSTANTLDWGKTGHRATGAIAEKHLTKKARKKIEKLPEKARKHSRKRTRKKM